MCTTTTWFLWQTSVGTGIKGVCHHCLVCNADQWGCFTLWSSGKLYLLKRQMKYHNKPELKQTSKCHQNFVEKLVDSGSCNPRRNVSMLLMIQGINTWKRVNNSLKPAYASCQIKNMNHGIFYSEQIL